MRSGLRLLSLLALAAACGDGAPIGAAPLSITAAVAEAPIGKAFPLEVVRTWPKGAEPDWSDETLAPLEVRLVSTARRESGGRVEETRRYEAYAFSLADLTEPVELRVTRALDPGAPGPAELPEAPAAGPPWAALLAAALGAMGLFLYVRRLRRPGRLPETVQPAPEVAAPEPHLRALERLERLRSRQPEGRAELQAFYLEATGLVRDYIGERFALKAAVLTSEELLARAAHAESLGGVLRHCDAVKFARHVATAPERERMLDGAEAFIRETRA